MKFNCIDINFTNGKSIMLLCDDKDDVDNKFDEIKIAIEKNGGLNGFYVTKDSIINLSEVSHIKKSSMRLG